MIQPALQHIDNEEVPEENADNGEDSEAENGDNDMENGAENGDNGEDSEGENGDNNAGSEESDAESDAESDDENEDSDIEDIVIPAIPEIREIPATPDQSLARYLPRIFNAAADNVTDDGQNLRGEYAKNYQIAEWFVRVNLVCVDGFFNEGEIELPRSKKFKCKTCVDHAIRFNTGCGNGHNMCAFCMYRVFFTLDSERKRQCMQCTKPIDVTKIFEV